MSSRPQEGRQPEAGTLRATVVGRRRKRRGSEPRSAHGGPSKESAGGEVVFIDPDRHPSCSLQDPPPGPAGCGILAADGNDEGAFRGPSGAARCGCAAAVSYASRRGKLPGPGEDDPGGDRRCLRRCWNSSSEPGGQKSRAGQQNRVGQL